MHDISGMQVPLHNVVQRASRTGDTADLMTQDFDIMRRGTNAEEMPC